MRRNCFGCRIAELQTECASYLVSKSTGKEIPSCTAVTRGTWIWLSTVVIELWAKTNFWLFSDFVCPKITRCRHSCHRRSVNILPPPKRFCVCLRLSVCLSLRLWTGFVTSLWINSRGILWRVRHRDKKQSVRLWGLSIVGTLHTDNRTRSFTKHTFTWYRWLHLARYIIICDWPCCYQLEHLFSMFLVISHQRSSLQHSLQLSDYVYTDRRVSEKGSYNCTGSWDETR